MANINPSNKKPPEFELIELLCLGIPKTFLLNCLFQVRFQSFIDQIPYYLYSSIKKNVKLTYSKIGISINNNIKVYSSLKDVKIRYISKNRLRIACKKLLHQKNDNIFNSNMIEHYKENKQWLDAKLYVYSNDGISIISYQKQYSSSAIQEYVVNLTKEDQAIEYNQERVGVVVFILANNLEYISHVKDHVLLNEESQNILTIRKCKQDDKYKKIFMFESNGIVDGSIHQHRGRRDIDDSCKIAGDNNDDDMLDSRDNNVMSSNSVGNILRPVGYNIINWIRRYNISKLNLNFVKQVKNWFEDDGSRIDEKKIDTSDHLEYRDSEILKLNQDILDSKLLEIVTIKQQIIELESKLVVAKRVLRESNQTVVTEENQYIDRQEQYKEYEEELSSRLYKLHEKKLKTKKNHILEYQELVRSEICDELECTKQNITRLDELNESYCYQLKKLRAELSQDQDTIRSLNDKIRNCEKEKIDTSDHLEYKDSEILKLNQDILDSKLLEIATIKQQIIELESKLVVAKRVLRELNQTVVTEENQYIDRQEQYKEYEEELSSRLYKLHEKKLKIKKNHILEYQELVRSEICDELECTKQNITRLDELNESYCYQLKKLRAELSQDQDTIRSLNDKIRNCEKEKIDTSDHLEYKDSEILKLNQDILDSKLLEIATIKQQIIELESKLVVAKRVLRELNQTVVTEENQYIDRQEQYKEYEEELSSRLYKLHEKKLKIKKNHILEYQELVRSEICDELECTKQNITRLDELNESYCYQLKKLRAELSQDQDTIRSLNDKIRDCEGEEEKLTNYLLSLKKAQEGRLDYSDELEELIQAECNKLDMNINKLLEKDKELSIRYKKLQDQRDEIKKIKDQIKNQELVIEDYDKKINKLGQYLGTLREEVKNLSQNNELLQYQKQILENVDDDIICCNSSQILNRFIDNNKSISNIVNKDIVVSYSEYAQNLTYSTYAAFDENRIEYIGGSVD